MQVRFLLRLIPFVLLISGLCLASAQSGAALRGVVEDDTGAIIPRAEVVLKSSAGKEAAHATSNDMGEFSFAGIVAGDYVLVAQAPNFKPGQTRISIGAAAPPLQHVRLKVANVTQEITVTAGDPVTMDGNMNSVEVNHDLLKSLPVRDDNPLAAASMFLDPASNGAEGTRIVVDGVESSSLDVPSSSVKTVAVNKNPYSAEFGRPGKGRIEVVTRPGSLTRVHHHLIMTFRNSSLDATNAFAASQPQMNRSFWEGDINGPLFGKKGSFYFGGDYLRDDKNSVINAHVPTGDFNQNVPSPERNGRLLGRVDYQINPTNIFSARYNFNRDSQDNRGISAFDLPERGYNNVAQRQEVRLGETALVSVNFSNELRFAYKKRDNLITPVSNQPANIVLGAFSSGGAQLNQDQNEQIFELQNLSTWVHGKHTIHFGATAKRHDVSVTDLSNFGGSYFFSGVDTFNANNPFLFTINQGNPNAGFIQDEYSYFIQDEMRLRPDLTVLLGLRHELQSHLHEYNNFAPRFGFSYSPGHSGLVIRAGAGIFYERRPWLMGQTAELFGLQHVSKFEIANPAFPVPPALIASVPPSTTTIAPSLVAPYQTQASAGADKQIGKTSALSVEYTYLRGLKLFFTRDINAPLSGVRPIPGFLNIDQFESGGSSRSHSVATTFRTAISTRVELLAQYTYSRTSDNTSGMFYLPADSFNPGADRGRSDFDRRHRFNLAGIFQLPHGFKFGTITSISSGIPFNITTGTDENGDGLANDRPAGVGRNTGDGPMYSNIDLRLSKRFVIGPVREHGTKYMEVRVDAFNALNQVNATNYVGVLTSEFFGRANSAFAARQLQLSMKASF